MRVRLLFAVAACSLSVAALNPVSSDAQEGTAYRGGGFGYVAAPLTGQNYATSRPSQSDSTGSSYQSMSPDSWGNSASAGPDPFAVGAPAGGFGIASGGVIAGSANGTAFAQQGGSNSFVPPNAAAVQQPSYRYESTGAPSMKALLGGTTEPAALPSSPSSLPPGTFRRADFDQKDPRDIPLAPTVPSSVLDGSGNQMDMTGPVLGGPAVQPNLPAPNSPPALRTPSGSPQQFPTSEIPADGQSFVPVGPVANGPYQMPQVFGPAPSAPVDFPAAQPAPPVDGFGWGNAPGLLQNNEQSAPTYRQRPAKDSHSRRRRKRPRFPLPFGLGGGAGGQADSNLNGATPVVPVDRPAVQPSIPMTMPNQQFRPDLGQRAPLPTVRNFGTYDSGRKEYDFEKKKTQYPPFSEILATGRYFGSIEGQFLKPRFNGSSGLAVLNQAGGLSSTDARVFDFDYELIPNLRFGFESKYGPGFEVDFRTLRTASVVQSFTSAADSSVSLRAALPDLRFGTQIATAAAGQTLLGAHTFNLESYGFSVFKEVQLPITRIGGAFGFHAVDIDHQVDATVVDGSGVTLQNLNTRSDMRAFGPRIRLDYFRPVGHTPLEFITSAGGSVLFGKRDQFILGPETFQRVGADEIVTTFEFLTALQIKQRIGESRSIYGRIGYLNQAFNGGGSGFLAQDNFGLRGITFGLGVNR